MPTQKYKNSSWINYLVQIGEFITSLSKTLKNENATIALCLPRVDYAATFIGIGIIKASHVETQINHNQVPLHQWVGNWVTYQNSAGCNTVGILEYCNDRGEFKIRHYKRGIPKLSEMTLEKRLAFKPPMSGALWTVLHTKDWPFIMPIGREFNEARRVGSHQIERIVNTNESISNQSKFFDFDFSKLNISNNKSIFDIYCNKSRINREISESLSSDSDAIPSEILKPKESNFDKSTHYCEIKSNKIELNSIRGSIMLIESGNLLSDHLFQSRKFHRVILLGRNMPNYQESAHLITQEYGISTQDIKIKRFNKPEINVLAFLKK